jgi:hypothetical protein
MKPQTELDPDPIEGANLAVMQRQWQHVNTISHRINRIAQMNMTRKVPKLQISKIFIALIVQAHASSPFVLTPR